MTYTLHEINAHIRQALALNFADALWVRCEIGQWNESSGHIFIDVVQKSGRGDELVARAEAVIWKRQYRNLQRKSKQPLEKIIVEGNEVSLQVRVDFHERYGYKLIVEDIDEDYTLGKIWAKRNQVLEQLKAEQLLQRNAALKLPKVIQKVAIISSANAAGLQDFLAQISNNPYQYQVECCLYPALMQGDKAAQNIAAQLRLIPAFFDVVVIIRGGGARLDLSAFDEYVLGDAIAKCPIVVMTGIGHDIDETVADHAAHTALKTPTAVADCIIYHNSIFENQVTQLVRRVGEWATHRWSEYKYQQERLQQQLSYVAQQKWNQHQRNLDQADFTLQNQSLRYLQGEFHSLDILSSKIEALDWQPTLERGFAIVAKNGERIYSMEQLSHNDYLDIQFKDGTVSVVVEGKED